ncbi:TetR/AcrR family transcriptional regulator [Streptacidiphilus fuscans]|uniref:TetR/AcrR family transcriptional regulator n=1 Tax=Streptacidiphilus fuscans TaxID=2789292 RepID=UPI002E2E20C2|nr:TetR family transcriptional regulator [Streptacidiphilus fuscans]
MTGFDFERARSPEAKRARQDAILVAASRLATANGVREVTASAIADEVGMHKSAMLRYFETREDIFLQLATGAWDEWSAAVRADLEGLTDHSGAGRPDWDRNAHEIAAVIARSLVSRPLFCDLLAHTPLNLERNVSLERVREFKTHALAAVAEISSTLCTITPLRFDEAHRVVATATSMAGAMWQMAAPGTRLRDFYESEPELAHAVVDVEPQLTDILRALLTGYAARSWQ